MSVKTEYGGPNRIDEVEFKRPAQMSYSDCVLEFLYVSKIHRYEKIWLKEIRKLTDRPEEYKGYGIARRIIDIYGNRKRLLREHLRQNNRLDFLHQSIEKENKGI